MKTIIEYAIVSEINPFDVAKQVNEKIKEGYQPYGDIQYCDVGPSGNQKWFLQVLVKYQ